MSDTAMNSDESAASDLDARIAAAFQPGAKSADVAKLISEAEAASITSGEVAERARNRALDPASSPHDVAMARREMENAAFRRDRLRVAVQKLTERLNELRRQEEDQRRQLAYDRVKTERDALAEELARVYPPIVAQLTDLLARIEANDREVEYVSGQARPSGAGRLLVAELVARGLRGFVENSFETPRLTRNVRLPAFERSVHEPFAWSRSR
jgi:hypothetical protein